MQGSRVPASLLKVSGERTIRCLSAIIAQIWSAGVVPPAMIRRLVTPICEYVGNPRIDRYAACLFPYTGNQ